MVVLAGWFGAPLPAVRPPGRGVIKWWQAAGLLGGGAGLLVGLRDTVRMMEQFFIEVPVQVAYSDIIPAVQIYVRRWLWGSDVYRPLTHELGYPALPTYLPATWFPFIAAELGDFDYRWMAVGGLLAGVVAVWAWLVWLRRPWLETLLKAAFPVALIYSVLVTDPSIFVYSVEAMVAGYVLLLGAALLTRSLVLRAGALALCLLSRYFLVLWVPLLALLLLREGGWRRLLQFGALSLALLGAAYLWPVWRHDPGLMLRVQESYQQVAVNEWQNFNPATGRPYHPFNGLGLAAWFYPAAPTLDLIRTKVAHMRTVQLMGVGLVVAGVALGWWRRRKLTPDPARERWLAVLSLKLLLVVFFALLHVPYAYMLLVSVCLTGLIVGAGPSLWRYRIGAE